MGTVSQPQQCETDFGAGRTVARTGRCKKKEGVETVSRTAEEPGQTLNVDLCFVPASQEVEIKLPAVSGSSGRLIVERPKDELSEPDYPGLVFADDSLAYSEAMKQFVTARQPKDNQTGQAEGGSAAVKKVDLKAKKQAFRREKEMWDESACQV